MDSQIVGCIICIIIVLCISLLAIAYGLAAQCPPRGTYIALGAAALGTAALGAANIFSDNSVPPRYVGGRDAQNAPHMRKTEKYSAPGEAAACTGDKKPFYGECIVLSEINAINKFKQMQFDDVPMSLDHDNDPVLEYRSDKDFKISTVVHLGQRKLLMGLVSFMADYADKASVVVYAGAAPGYNIIMVADMYPNHQFHLYDVGEFTKEKRPNVFYHDQLFLDNDAAYWANNPDAQSAGVLLVSDIRRSFRTETAFGPTTESIVEDMDDQLRWYNIMKPAGAMFKFRPPFFEPGVTPETLEYLDGDIQFQTRVGRSSTETRLVVGANAKMRTYNVHKYESQCYYHNIVRRKWGSYAVPSVGICPGIDNCYDCALEWKIWEKYLKSQRSQNETITPADIEKLMLHTSKTLKQVLTMPPHGIAPQTPMPERMLTLIQYKKEADWREKRIVKSKIGLNKRLVPRLEKAAKTQKNARKA